MLTEIVTHTPFPATFDKQIADSSLIYSCLYPAQSKLPWTTNLALNEYKQWQSWKQKLIGTQTTATLQLCFQLHEAPGNDIENWRVNFLAASRKDPSLKLALDDYWYLDEQTKKAIQGHFGKEFEKDLLLSLGYAARMYPKIWQGLETDKPTGLQLTLEEAFEFLKQSAWVLEDAGYKVIIPAWWTPQGRQRAKIRLKASPKQASATKAGSKGYFSLETIIQYQYELAIAGQRVTEQEWQQLVNAKTPLVQFRGQWIELDQNKMKQMLDFWQAHGQDSPEMTLLDLMKKQQKQMKLKSSLMTC